jgi:hypothetical protein
MTGIKPDEFIESTVMICITGANDDLITKYDALVD